MIGRKGQNNTLIWCGCIVVNSSCVEEDVLREVIRTIYDPAIDDVSSSGYYRMISF